MIKAHKMIFWDCSICDERYQDKKDAELCCKEKKVGK